MALQIVKSANFGSRKSGLSTVGYALYNSDLSLYRARETSGVSEVAAGTGIYSALISFDDLWQGIVLWDTGEATPMYAPEDFDYRNYQNGAGGGFVVNGEFLTKQEKQGLVDMVKGIALDVVSLKNSIKAFPESILPAIEGIQAKLGEIRSAQADKTIVKGIEEVDKNIKESYAKLEKLSIPNNSRYAKMISESRASIESAVSKLKESVEAITFAGLESAIKDIKESLEAVAKEVNLSVRIGAKVISTEALADILKEDGIDVSGIPAKRIKK